MTSKGVNDVKGANDVIPDLPHERLDPESIF